MKKNKMKIRKSAQRRFKITKTGKVLRRQAFRRHLKASKSKKRLSNLKKKIEVKGFYAKKLKKALGAKKPSVKKPALKKEKQNNG